MPSEKNDDRIATKLCKGKCGKELELWEFPEKGNGRLSDWCKSCHRAYSKEHYKKNKKEKIKKSIEWQKKNPEKAKRSFLKWRQKANKIPLTSQRKPTELPPEKEDILSNILPISPKKK